MKHKGAPNPRWLKVSAVYGDLGGGHFICWGLWWLVHSAPHKATRLKSISCFCLLTSFMERLISCSCRIFPKSQNSHQIISSLCYYYAQLVSHLTWPEPYTEFTGRCQDEDEQHPAHKYRWAEGHYQSNLVFSDTSAVPQAATLHSYSNSW